MLNIVTERRADIQRPPHGGRAAPQDMAKNAKKHAIRLHSSLNVTIAGHAAATVNPEGHQRTITAVRFKENGVTTMEFSGRQLAWLAQEQKYQTANIGQLANTNNGVQQLDADFVIRFADLFGADPSETCYVELNPAKPVQVEIEFEPDGNIATDLMSGITTETVTVNSHVVTISEELDYTSKVMPYFLPRIKRAQSNNIAGVRQAFPIQIYPEGQNRVSGFLFHALKDNVTDDGMFGPNLTLRGDKARYWDNVPVAQVLDQFREQFLSPAARAGFLRLRFKQYGKLTGCYWATQDNNLRLEVDVNGSGTVNVADFLSLELAFLPGYTRNLPAGF